MDPRAWIYGILGHLPGILANPLRRVADRIFSIFDDGVTFARWIKSGIGYWYSYALSLAATLVTLGAEAVTTFTWIVKTFIPQRISAAITAIKQWATPLINAALNTARSLIDSLRKWATTQINSALSLLTSLRNWINSEIAKVKDKLKQTVDQWYERLTHPDKMVAWLLGALITALQAYLYSKRDALARWFLRSSPAFTEWLASVLLKVLERVL